MLIVDHLGWSHPEQMVTSCRSVTPFKGPQILPEKENPRPALKQEPDYQAEKLEPLLDGQITASFYFVNAPNFTFACSQNSYNLLRKSLTQFNKWFGGSIPFKSSDKNDIGLRT